MEAALESQLRLFLLHAVARLGADPASPALTPSHPKLKAAQPAAPSSSDLKKMPSSTSVAHHKHAVAELEQQARTLARETLGRSEIKGMMVQSAAEERHLVLQTERQAQALAVDETLDPVAKCTRCSDLMTQLLTTATVNGMGPSRHSTDAHRPLSGGAAAGGPSWEAALPFAALRVALERMRGHVEHHSTNSNDDEEDSGGGPLAVVQALHDLGLIYVMLQRYEMARDTSNEALGMLKATTQQQATSAPGVNSSSATSGGRTQNMHTTSLPKKGNNHNPNSSSSTTIHARLEMSLRLIETLALIGIDNCSRALGKAKRLAHDRPQSVVVQLALVAALCRTTQESADVSYETRRCADLIEAGEPSLRMSRLACLTAAEVGPHVDLLAKVDAQLRTPAVHEHRDQLMEEASHAVSKRDILRVKEKLDQTVMELQRRSEELQLTVVRQVEHIAQRIRLYVQRDLRTHMAVSRPTRAALHSVLTLQLVEFRCLAVGARTSDCAARSDALLKGFEYVLGRCPLLSTLQLDAALALLQSDCLRYPQGVVSGLRRWAAPAASQHRALASDIEAQLLHRLNATSSETNRDNDEDDDEDDEAKILQKGCRIGESVVTEILARDHETAEASAQLRAVLEALIPQYRSRNADAAESRCTALLAALACRVYGPGHPYSVQRLLSHAGRERRVHAPIAEPAWGVLPLHSTIELRSETPGADVYYALGGDAPAVHESYRYSGRIVLDRVGRMTVKAFAKKDNDRSGLIEVHYTVQKR